MSANGWSVSWGCEEWQSIADHLPKEEACAKYAELVSDLPTMGLYTANFVILADENGQTVESWEEGDK